MNQQEVRKFVETYLDAFSSTIVEVHPAYLTVKLPETVDRDIGNRPFYWSWVERMNIPPQPMTLTFLFDPENAPEGIRGEPVFFGAGRLNQIFQSAQKHGRFVCLYEQINPLSARGSLPARRSLGLTPWLNLNVKVSFICDKKRDVILYLGINLHQPRIVQDFYAFVKRLPLGPSIPNYTYTLERRLTLQQAFLHVEQEVQRIINEQDPEWALQARKRLQEELEILETYYAHLEQQEEEENDRKNTGENPVEPIEKEQREQMDPQPAPPLTLEQHQAAGGRILDFLRMYGIPETPRPEKCEEEWKSSTPEEEKERRMAELKWQYEPRIEVKFINGGLFYLYNMPPFLS
jgi:hypothetical protein